MSTMHTVDYKLGQIDSTLKALAKNQEEFKDTITAQLAAQAVDIAEIKNKQAENRGERRVAVWVAGGVGSLVMLILTALGKKIGIIS